jgi:ATP synthase subunit 6
MFSPLEQFSIVSFFSLRIPATNCSFLLISNFVLMLFFIFIIFFVTCYLIEKNNNRIFTSLAIVFNNYYCFLVTIIRENFIKKGFFFMPYLFLLMSFLLVANLLGMVPYSFALTSHFAITLFLSFLTFFSAVALGFQKHGVNFFSIFLPNGAPFLLAPFLIAVEFISYLARLFSLAIRLFANIMSGHTLLKILAGFGWVLTVFVASLLGLVPVIVVFVITGLEIVIAFLQAYVFTVLSSIYINEALQLH